MSKITIANRYGVCPHSLLYDPAISFKAKGLYAYIQAKSDGWDFSAERIALETSDGRDGIRSGLQELVKFGYLFRKLSKTDKGQWASEYILYDKPTFELPTDGKPATDNPMTDNPTSEKPSSNKERIINKDLEKNKKLISNDITTSLVSPTQEIKEYGDPKINQALAFLKKSCGVTDFKEAVGKQRFYCNHIVKLTEKIGKEEMIERLQGILEDDFKAKNCNKIAYLYGELKSFIHSPMVEKKSHSIIV